MRALIVDDEPLARKELARLLVEYPRVEIVGEARNVEEAVTEIARLRPGLVFLDIEMPGGTGSTSSHDSITRHMSSSPRPTMRLRCAHST